jgi:hypothetical protein
MAFTISRRSVLTQLAAIPITSMFARNLLAQTAGAAPKKRLIAFMQNNGTKRCNFWPTGTGQEFALPQVGPSMPPILNSLFTTDGKATDNGLRAKTTVLKGLQMVGGSGGTNGNQHDIGFARMWTGAPLVSYQGAPWGGAISIDQMLATYWNTPSATTAVYASSVEPFPKKGFNHRVSFSYEASTRLHVPDFDPYKAFHNVFGGFMPSSGSGGTTAQQDAAFKERVALRQSVLDSVSKDLTALQARLGADDSRKLDAHLAAVKSVENQLQMMSNTTVVAGCTPPTGDPMWFGPSIATSGAGGQPPGFEVNQETYNHQMIQFMAALVSAAIRCGMTRVGSVQFGYGGGKAAFGHQSDGTTPWLNPATTLNPMATYIGFNHHDGIAHKDGSDLMDNQPIANYVTWINQYYAVTVQKVALDLLRTPEGAGTMLDNTLIIWANELGRGDHQLANMPILFIGNVGPGAIAAGGRCVDWSKGGAGALEDHRVFGYHALKSLGYDMTRQDAAVWNAVASAAYSGF